MTIEQITFDPPIIFDHRGHMGQAALEFITTHATHAVTLETGRYTLAKSPERTVFLEVFENGEGMIEEESADYKRYKDTHTGIETAGRTRKTPLPGHTTMHFELRGTGVPKVALVDSVTSHRESIPIFTAK